MKINEVSKLTGLSKRAIRYYTEYDLVKPVQLENGYFDFNEKDVENLINIHRMRMLGLSVEHICKIMRQPSTAFYYFNKQIKKMDDIRVQAELNIAALTKITEQLGTGTDASDLNQLLSENVRYFSAAQNPRPIDISDAEILANFFWGRFEGEKKRSEFEQFLFEKFKRQLIFDQADYAIRLRDILLSLDSSEVEMAFLARDYDNSSILELSQLDESSYENYVHDSMTRTAKHLKDPSFLRNLPVMSEYTFVAGDFFTCNTAIMFELSPNFKRYSDNYNKCHALLYDAYLKGEDEGIVDSFIHLIEEKKTSEFDNPPVVYAIRIILTDEFTSSQIRFQH